MGISTIYKHYNVSELEEAMAAVLNMLWRVKIVRVLHCLRLMYKALLSKLLKSNSLGSS